jgi:hypothetical protein
MTSFLKVKLVSSRPLDIPRDVWRAILRKGHQDVGDAWHTKILPEHFTARARAKYRHRLRRLRYDKRKREIAASGRPWSRQNPNPVILAGAVDNVLTGFMMKQLQQSKTVRAFPSRVTITMYGPTYISANTFTGNAKQAMQEGWTYGKGKKFSAKSGNQPDKRREITTVTQEEKRMLAGVLEQSVSEQLAAYRAPTTINI